MWKAERKEVWQVLLLRIFRFLLGGWTLWAVPAPSRRRWQSGSLPPGGSESSRCCPRPPRPRRLLPDGNAADAAGIPGDSQVAEPQGPLRLGQDVPMGPRRGNSYVGTGARPGSPLLCHRWRSRSRSWPNARKPKNGRGLGERSPGSALRGRVLGKSNFQGAWWSRSRPGATSLLRRRRGSAMGRSVATARGQRG